MNEQKCLRCKKKPLLTLLCFCPLILLLLSFSFYFFLVMHNSYINLGELVHVYIMSSSFFISLLSHPPSFLWFPALFPQFCHLLSYDLSFILFIYILNISYKTNHRIADILCLACFTWHYHLKSHISVYYLFFLDECIIFHYIYHIFHLFIYWWVSRLYSEFMSCNFCCY